MNNVFLSSVRVILQTVQFRGRVLVTDVANDESEGWYAEYFSEIKFQYVCVEV